MVLNFMIMRFLAVVDSPQPIINQINNFNNSVCYLQDSQPRDSDNVTTPPGPRSWEIHPLWPLAPLQLSQLARLVSNGH